MMNLKAAPSDRLEQRCEEAKQRLLARPGDPFVVVQWHRIVFLHYEIEPAVVKQALPSGFELELYRGRAIASLVAVTKRRFRPHSRSPFWIRIVGALREQRMFNLRTYVRFRGEPGAFFFWSWLSRPWGLPLPPQPFGLTCSFAVSRFQHDESGGLFEGALNDPRSGGRFDYQARLVSRPGAGFQFCEPDSLEEFAEERYTGYYGREGRGRVFRAWHPPWLRDRLELVRAEGTLIEETFPWFQEARFLSADYAPGFEEVWLGRPHPLAALHRYPGRLSRLFEMP